MDNSKKWLDEAGQLYERAVTGVLNKCSLLYFTFADFEEANMNFEKVHKIYQDFLAVQDIDPTLGYIQYMKFCRRAEGIKVGITWIFVFFQLFFHAVCQNSFQESARGREIEFSCVRCGSFDGILQQQRQQSGI